MGVDLVWLDAAGKQIEMVADESSVISAAIERVREDRGLGRRRFRRRGRRLAVRALST